MLSVSCTFLTSSCIAMQDSEEISFVHQCRSTCSFTYLGLVLTSLLQTRVQSSVDCVTINVLLVHSIVLKARPWNMLLLFLGLLTYMYGSKWCHTYEQEADSHQLLLTKSAHATISVYMYISQHFIRIASQMRWVWYGSPSDIQQTSLASQPSFFT